ncbi:hypothetical protein A0H76_590 [Hepatospora eriocheir]|uniref:Uncharacterized protein n=1 Tax=Hepatospora eriocheir TaxID=1081669 RepID=A0A1X0QLC1_9MICR|nr:hypothetical protein HERIO_413 [Hepatospora eriocheir]ORE00476.1 hypothetical protein A0H76_590 [Hepatospora eriocheir]
MFLNYINVGFLALNSVLLLLIIPENNSLISLNDLSHKLIGIKVPNIITCSFIATLVFIIPLMSTMFSLGFFKYNFNSNQKCMIKSYRLLTSLLISSYLLRQFRNIFLFYIKLGSSQSFYFFIRASKCIDTYHSYYLIYETIQGYVIQASMFMLFHSLLELVITYKQTSIDFRGITRFIYRCRFYLFIVFTLTIFYVNLVYFGELFMEKIGIDPIKSSYSIGIKIYESFFINLCVLYVYFIVALEGVL